MATKNTSKASKGNKANKPAATTAASSARAAAAAELLASLKANAPKPAGKGKGGSKASKGDKGKPAVPKVKENPVKVVKNGHGVPVETKLNTATDGRMAGAFASVRIFGFPLSQVLRVMGKNGISAKQCRGIMDAIGLEAVRSNTIADKIGEGRNGADVTYAGIGGKELKKLKALIPADE